MLILAIDPGDAQSSVVTYDAQIARPTAHATLPNIEVLKRIRDARSAEVSRVVVEMIASYGMPVGAEVFETCVWIGRFIHCADSCGLHTDRVFRREVKAHLCHDSRAKDSNIRQALIDIYGPGKDAAIGKKATPGPLYGFSGDAWAALAVARTYADTRLKVPFHP